METFNYEEGFLVEEEELASFELNDNFALFYSYTTDVWFIEGTEPEEGEIIVDEAIDPLTFEGIDNIMYSLSIEDFNKCREIILESLR